MSIAWWIRLILLMAASSIVAGCEPGVHVAWEKQFDGSVDDRCIEQALKAVAPDMRRATYISEGRRGFPRGTEVTQFNYSDPHHLGGYSLDIASLPNGTTVYYHEWSKIGTDIPPEEKAKVLPLLNRANATVARRCRLSFEGSSPREGSG